MGVWRGQGEQFLGKLSSPPNRLNGSSATAMTHWPWVLSGGVFFRNWGNRDDQGLDPPIQKKRKYFVDGGSGGGG
jgi:hypothetical protein